MDKRPMLPGLRTELASAWWKWRRDAKETEPDPEKRLALLAALREGWKELRRDVIRTDWEVRSQSNEARRQIWRDIGFPFSDKQ